MELNTPITSAEEQPQEMFCGVLSVILVAFVLQHSVAAARVQYGGKFKERCPHDGIYYKDENSFVVCTNGYPVVQRCPKGTINFPDATYSTSRKYATNPFCGINTGVSKSPTDGDQVKKEEPHGGAKTLSSPKSGLTFQHLAEDINMIDQKGRQLFQQGHPVFVGGKSIDFTKDFDFNDAEKELENYKDVPKVEITRVVETPQSMRSRFKPDNDQYHGPENPQINHYSSGNVYPGSLPKKVFDDLAGQAYSGVKHDNPIKNRHLFSTGLNRKLPGHPRDNIDYPKIHPHQGFERAADAYQHRPLAVRTLHSGKKPSLSRRGRFYNDNTHQEYITGPQKFDDYHSQFPHVTPNRKPSRGRFGPYQNQIQGHQHTDKGKSQHYIGDAKRHPDKKNEKRTYMRKTDEMSTVNGKMVHQKHITVYGKM